MKLKRLLFSLTLPFLAGALGSIFTVPSIKTWYASIIRPEFAPPNYLFGPVWTTLYFLMGISFYIIWQKAGINSQAARFYLFQLFLNTIWSPAFFGLRSPRLGLIIILALLLSIVHTMKLFSKISKTAEGLLFPYLTWVSFATLLNYFIVLLN